MTAPRPFPYAADAHPATLEGNGPDEEFVRPPPCFVRRASSERLERLTAAITQDDLAANDDSSSGRLVGDAQCPLQSSRDGAVVVFVELYAAHR